MFCTTKFYSVTVDGQVALLKGKLDLQNDTFQDQKKMKHRIVKLFM